MTQVNLSTKQKQAHRHREHIMVAMGEGTGKRDGLGGWG